MFYIPKNSIIVYTLVKIMEKILFQTKLPYLTTSYLLSLYADYKYPRDKIKQLVKSRDLIHVKQGVYILGETYQRNYSHEVISGMLYGPSAISLEFALSFHGLIPERVEEVTCICFKRDKRFNTPVGRFSYKYLPIEKYTHGIEYRKTYYGNFFIATPEKALCDKVYFSTIREKYEMADYLLDDLRIEKDELKGFDLKLLTHLSHIYKRKNCQYLLQTVAEFQLERE